MSPFVEVCIIEYHSTIKVTGKVFDAGYFDSIFGYAEVAVKKFYLLGFTLGTPN